MHAHVFQKYCHVRIVFAQVVSQALSLHDRNARLVVQISMVDHNSLQIGRWPVSRRITGHEIDVF